MSEGELKDYILEMKKLNQETYVMAQCTNELLIESCDVIMEKLKQLLAYGFDIRIFNVLGEIKLFRADICSEFLVRKKIDSDKNDMGVNSYWDEEQYLDIDLQKSHDGEVVTTGGGCYKVPLIHLKDAKIRIRNYVRYDEESGMVSVYDWRIVKFVEGSD